MPSRGLASFGSERLGVLGVLAESSKLRLAQGE